ncbi:MAG: hypothetical protein WA890_07255 [Micromonospora sp.]
MSEVGVDFAVVEDPSGEQVGDPFAHVVLGCDDVVGADAGEGVAVLGADRLDPDVGDAEFGQTGLW